MVNYHNLYLRLFNGISDIIESMEIDKNEHIEIYISKLKQLQIETEEEYISQDED